MRYICTICGYVYDDEKEKVPFSELPDNWVCPICKAGKSAFKQEEVKEEKKVEVKPLVVDDDMKQLSAGELSAICSNLARGCEKQYKARESQLFTELAAYFKAASPEIEDADETMLHDLLKDDLDRLYPALSSVAKEEGDRGTQRITVWGEKVTAILYSLLERYEKEGDAFLKDTKIWVCSVCGFVYVGDSAPELCPVCKVPAWKFDCIEGRTL